MLQKQIIDFSEFASYDFTKKPPYITRIPSLRRPFCCIFTAADSFTGTGRTCRKNTCVLLPRKDM